MSVDKSAIIHYLSNCSGNELVEILTRSFEKRPENGIHPLEPSFESRLVLGEVFRQSEDNAEWSEWKFNLIADMNPEFYERTFEGEPFLQAGECRICKVEIVSHVKNALCPLCRNEVYLT